MRNPIDPDLPPVTLPECDPGIDRYLYAAALLCLAVLVAAAWLFWRWVTPLWGVR